MRSGRSAPSYSRITSRVVFLTLAGENMIDPERYFVHQWNAVGKIESICSVCGLTACTELSLSRVHNAKSRIHALSGLLDDSTAV